MKQIKYLFTVLFVGSLTIACKKLSDMKPNSSLTKEDFFQTTDDAKASVMAIYSALTEFSTALQLFHWGDARADQTSNDVWWGQDGDVKLAKKQLLDPNNYLANWGPMYRVIQRCNDAIKNISEMPVSIDFNQTTKDNLLEEARTLRAYCYFMLVRVFGEVPLVLDPSDNTSKDYLVPQNKEEEVLKQINDDLDSAIANMGDPDRSASGRRRASRGAAKALKTHVLLWQNQYEAAEAMATKTLAEGYTLEGSTSYMSQFWTSGGTNEIIFSLGYDQNRANPIMDKQSWYGGGYGIIPAQFWFRKFRGEPIRGAGAGKVFDNIDDNGYGLILKLQGGGTGRLDVPVNTPRDYPVLRLADIYLLRAEARNRMPGHEADALADLNVIRKRAQVAEYQLSDLATLEAREDAILNERNIELAFEGQRWFDLLRVARHGRPNVLYTEATNLLAGDQKAEAQRILKDKGPQSWLFPISRTELLNNPKLKQNPAWEK